MERLTAGLIVLLCTITALGNWAVAARDTPDSADSGGGRFSFASTSQLGEIEVIGAITGHGGSSGASGAKIVAALRKAEEDGVKGLLLTVDTPGGSAAASQEVFDEIMRIRKQHKIPVVCTMGDIAASGGYYVAAATDEIVANRATLTGSIGVIMQVFNAQGLMQKIGIAPETIKSGPFKDIASPFRPIRPDERQLLQGVIDSTYQQFLQDVATGRKMPINQVKNLAGGRIYTGEQAKKNGLVDSLGSRTDALRILARRAGLKGTPSIKNYSKGGWQSILAELPLSEKLQTPDLARLAAPYLAPPRTPLALYE